MLITPPAALLPPTKEITALISSISKYTPLISFVHVWIFRHAQIALFVAVE